MIERTFNDTLQYQLVKEEELTQLVQSGEKLQNAYVYGVSTDDIDAELFNPERITQKSFEIFSPTIKFEHCSELSHQNHLTRKSTSIKPKQAPIAVSAKKEPAIKQEIKKNDTVKPKKVEPAPPSKDEKKQ